MPQVTKNNPDWIDVENMTAALAEGYGVVVHFYTRLRTGRVEVIGKTHCSPYDIKAPVTHVALVSFPVTQARDMASVYYSVAFDLWCQHDGGGATAATRGQTRGWDGRLEVPRRRNRH